MGSTRSAVAIIRAYAELVETQAASQPKADATREVMGHILDQADLMGEWVEAMLDVQRLRLGKLPLELSRVDLVRLAWALAEEFRQTTQAHRMRVAVVGPALTPVLADRCRVRQALANLLENEMKYASGGTIELRIGVQAHAHRVMIAVRDEGRAWSRPSLSASSAGSSKRRDRASTGSGVWALACTWPARSPALTAAISGARVAARGTGAPSCSRCRWTAPAWLVS